MICDSKWDSSDLKDFNQFFCIARYIVNISLILGMNAAYSLLYECVHKKSGLNIWQLCKLNKYRVITFFIAYTVLHKNNQKLHEQNFACTVIAYCILKFPEITSGAKLSWGIGMAFDYVEGHLEAVIPSNGGDIVGILGNIATFESTQHVIFPVKKLFIIITKTLYCPPDLREFNDPSEREGVARLESCSSLGPVIRDVAGLRDRQYDVMVYKINRPGKRPVYLAAEFVTSLHTFYKVLRNRLLYEEIAPMNVEEIRTDFVTMLRKVLLKNQELKSKCELVFFDDTKGLNLADVLLKRIKKLEPKFEEVIVTAAQSRSSKTNASSYRF